MRHQRLLLCVCVIGSKYFAGVCKVLSKEETLQAHRQVRKFLQHDNRLSIVVRTSIVAVLGLLFLGATLGGNVMGAHAQAASGCSARDHTYRVIGGDTLSGIASRYGAHWRMLASRNQIANPNLIYINQVICIPGRGSAGSVHKTHVAAATPAPRIQVSIVFGNGNVFPYRQCTWWAAERYHQLHGVYVPWTTNANAWQWTARAYNFGWHVSSTPTVGSIIDLQPGVQGAYGYGHVGVVEQVLRNGHVIASSMNWGSNPYAVSHTEFAYGAGVTFIRQ